PELVTAHAAILLAPPVIRQLRNADLANRIRHRHPLAAQNFNLPKLRDNLVGLVSLVCHRGPPSWSKPYFKVGPFNGGGSHSISSAFKSISSAAFSSGSHSSAPVRLSLIMMCMIASCPTGQENTGR